MSGVGGVGSASSERLIAETYKEMNRLNIMILEEDMV